MGAIGSVSDTHKVSEETPAANLVEHKKKVVCNQIRNENFCFTQNAYVVVEVVLWSNFSGNSYSR